jgi:hypothetical protein
MPSLCDFGPESAPRSITNEAGMPCIAVAALFGGTDLLRLLVEWPTQAADLRAAHLAQALVAAAQCGHSAEVEVLLEAGSDPNANPGGRVVERPLWQCVFSAESNLSTLRQLLAAGADVSPVDENGLHIADYLTPEQRQVFDEIRNSES